MNRAAGLVLAGLVLFLGVTWCQDTFSKVASNLSFT
jgi:hypothetical protein